MILTIKTAKAWKVRPSELIGVDDDPYVAYCFDSACAFILEQLLHRRMPKFADGGEKQIKGGKKQTTNSAIIAQMQKANKCKA